VFYDNLDVLPVACGIDLDSIPGEDVLQQFRIDRFFYEGQGTHGHNALVGFWLHIAGYDNHHAGKIFLADSFKYLVTVHHRHIEIQEQELGLTGANGFKPLLAIARKTYASVPTLRQGPGQLLAGKT